MGIKVGPLFLIQEKIAAARALGSTETDINILSMIVLQELIDLVREHVSVSLLVVFMRELSKTIRACTSM